MSTSGLRRAEPSRDTATIVSLIELGFAHELDPQGRKMLAQMRARVRQGHWARWFSDADWDEPPGFVWEDAGVVVANLSLREAYPRERKGRLIGNVVVHPDYRGRGIGRALVEAALEAARKDAEVRWVGLEVRVDNAPACHLYESLGFELVGQMHHLLRPGKLSWPEMPPPQRAWRASRPRHRQAWDNLAREVYGTRQVWVLESRPGLYDYGGFERNLDLWACGQRERAWLYGAEKLPELAVRLKSDFRHQFHLWDFLVQPPAGSDGVQEALAKAYRGLGWLSRAWPIVALVADQLTLVQALDAAGFSRHRTLGQMLLTL